MPQEEVPNLRSDRQMTRDTADTVRAKLHAQGFDRASLWRVGPGEWQISVQCSTCAALVINGVACHETGCPNETRECSECEARIPKRQRLCQSCADSKAEYSEQEYNSNGCWPEDGSDGERDTPEPEDLNDG